MAYLDVIERVARSALRVAAPPPLLTGSQWADEFLYLSPEESSEAGKYRVNRAPYQREMLDIIGDPGINEIVYCTGSQIGKTLIIKAILGYHIHQDPGPILVLMPCKEVAEAFSKDRLATMIRDSPALRGLIADPKSRSSGNTILHKTFPGGQITMVGANAPSGLASRPIRIVVADEVDRYPESAGTEGDPLFLARQRTATYWNRKIVMASTPTVEGASRIWRAFERSDQRHYYLPCPHCGDFHLLKWPQIVWDEGDPSSARAVCPVCGAIYQNADKLKMLPRGEWRKHAQSHKTAGFHISALYSPWQTFADVVQEFLDKKDTPETLKTFVNLQLGECWEDRTGEKLDEHALMARRERWTDAPDDVLVITAGVDVQNDRLEISLVGWTALEQARVLHHVVLPGPPGEPAIWTELDRLLLRPLSTSSGRALPIAATCVDSGGHHTQAVYKFCEERMGRKILAIAGRSGPRPIWPTKLSTRKLKNGSRLHIVGVDTAKDSLHAALAVKQQDRPKYIAFAAELQDEYFRQLVAERRVTKTTKNGGAVRTWVKKPGARNEALDCLVYALAALKALESARPKLLRTLRPDPPPAIARPADLPAMPPPVTATGSISLDGWARGR